MMSNGALCCAAGVCCPPIQARTKLAEMLIDAKVCSEKAEADKVAAFVHDEFVLFPRGHGLEQVVGYVKDHAKG